MTEIAKETKDRLKRAGFNAKRVSVRHEQYSMGSTMHVTIRDPEIRESQVRELVQPAERIDRCEITGEILCGGNRFLDIRYSDEAEAIRRNRVRDACAAAVAELPDDDNTLQPIGSTGLLVGRGDHKYGFKVFADHALGHGWYCRHASNVEGVVGIVADTI